MLPEPRSLEVFKNTTAAVSACVWVGPHAVDAPGPIDVSSAQGIVVQAAWFGTIAVLARWSVKTAQAIEDLVAGALESVSAAGRDLSATVSAAGRDFGATVTVLTDHAVTELAVAIAQAGALARWLSVLTLVIAVWSISHRVWNRYMHALHGNPAYRRDGGQIGPEGNESPQGAVLARTPRTGSASPGRVGPQAAASIAEIRRTRRLRPRPLGVACGERRSPLPCRG